jgi:hypothetical protein
MGGYTRAVSGQLLGKHVPANHTPLPGSRFLIMQQLDYNNGSAAFSTWSVPEVISGTRLERNEFCTGV